MSQTIQIYSTETRAKEPLETLEPGRVRMYVCGPTVYDACHIGHARPAVVFDTIRRYLEYAGYAVTFISNVTDIDDKIINRANELGVSWRTIALRYQDEYERDMAALGVRSPTIRPKATEHIQEMLELIQGLEAKGAAYVTSRGVWFDVSSFADYGRLSGKRQDDESTEHRVETDPEKRNPQDFALWKFSKPGEPAWDSPWGAGRPGWHIECSAMSGKYSEMQLDIHGGGADLCFPHHENEIAQSESFSGKRFVRYWAHNGFITVAKETEPGDGDAAAGDAGEEVKMGKSKGNAFWLKDAFKLAPPAALRLWILNTHYRSPLLYKDELLTQAQAGLDRIYTCLEALERGLLALCPDPAEATVLKGVGIAMGHAADGETEEVWAPTVTAKDGFCTAMDDDFNTPQALAALYDFITVINGALAAPSAPSPAVHGQAYLLLIGLLGVLGLPTERPATGGGLSEGLAQLLLDVRGECRASKNFAAADRIRDGLGELGVTINDRGGETTFTLP